MKGPLVTGHALLAAIFLATSVTARSPNVLFKRDSTCPDTSQNQCNQAGLPDNFCCPATTTCIPLAGNTTVLCCPSGSSCDTIKPITCDISAQNVTLNTDSTLKTTALTLPLPTCGGQCVLSVIAATVQTTASRMKISKLHQARQQAHLPALRHQLPLRQETLPQAPPQHPHPLQIHLW